MVAVPTAPAGGEVAKRPAAATSSTAPARAADRTRLVVVVMVVFPLCGRSAFGAAPWTRTTGVRVTEYIAAGGAVSRRDQEMPA